LLQVVEVADLVTVAQTASLVNVKVEMQPYPQTELRLAMELTQLNLGNPISAQVVLTD
jgi:hypothetical protein